MSYNVKIVEKENYLRVEVSRKRTPGRETQNAIEYLSKIVALSCKSRPEKTGFRRVPAYQKAVPQ